MLTLTNIIAPVRGFDPDSREAEAEWKREAAIERIEGEIPTWTVRALREALRPCRRVALDEIITEAAYAAYDREHRHV